MTDDATKTFGESLRMLAEGENAGPCPDDDQRRTERLDLAGQLAGRMIGGMFAQRAFLPYLVDHPDFEPRLMVNTALAYADALLAEIDKEDTP